MDLAPNQNQLGRVSSGGPWLEIPTPHLVFRGRFLLVAPADQAGHRSQCSEDACGGVPALLQCDLNARRKREISVHAEIHGVEEERGFEATSVKLMSGTTSARNPCRYCLRKMQRKMENTRSLSAIVENNLSVLGMSTVAEQYQTGLQ